MAGGEARCSIRTTVATCRCPHGRHRHVRGALHPDHEGRLGEELGDVPSPFSLRRSGLRLVEPTEPRRDRPPPAEGLQGQPAWATPPLVEASDWRPEDVQQTGGEAFLDIDRVGGVRAMEEGSALGCADPCTASGVLTPARTANSQRRGLAPNAASRA